MIKISVGNCLDVLRKMPSDSVHCVVTSPPYWGLRDYGIEPSIWGGDPECEHAWGETVGSTSRADRSDEIEVIGSSDGKVGRGPRNPTPKTCFCVHCGAWRGAFGLEPTYQLFVENAVEVFREVRRVLRPDGTLWLNLGDSYATGAGADGASPGGGKQGARWKGGPPSDKSTLRGNGHVGGGPKLHALDPVPINRGIHTAEQSGKHGYRIDQMGPMTQPNRMPQPGLKPKDLCGIPWRVAFALQADGWYLRSDIIWSKPNPMPESVTDRPTKAHEYLFLLAKSERYYYDQEAILEECSPNTNARLSQNVQDQIGSLREHAGGKTNGNMKAVGRHIPGNKTHKGKTAYDAGDERHRTKAGLVDYATRLRKLAESGSGIKNNDSFDSAMAIMPTHRNKRTVWTVTTQPFSEAHFATFPPDLIEPCIKAGCPPGGVVLDPFFGAGTTGLVSDRLQRDCIGVELNPKYAAMAETRLKAEGGMFCDISVDSTVGGVHSAGSPSV